MIILHSFIYEHKSTKEGVRGALSGFASKARDCTSQSERPYWEPSPSKLKSKKPAS